MEQAIERAQLGDLEAGRLWLDIATELRCGSVPDIFGDPEPPADARVVQDDINRMLSRTPVVLADDGQLAYARAETEVLQRIPEESTPTYEAAGESLGETKAIPHRIAHPQAESEGPNSQCLSCTLPLIWIPRLGWVHDVEGHSASCDKALEAVDNR
jgi:hypothetical protein